MHYQSLIISRLETFKKATRKFNFNIGAIFILAILNIIYKIRITSSGIESASNLWNPTWLLLGPLLYYAFVTLDPNKRRVNFFGPHFVPFYVYLIFFTIDLFVVDQANPWQSSMYAIYQNSFFVIPLSLLGYSAKIFINRKSINALHIKGELLFIICGFYIIIGVLYVLMYVCWGVLNIDMGLDYRIFTYGFLLLISAFILRYAKSIKHNDPVYNLNHTPVDSVYLNSSLRPELAAEYVEKIMSYFRNSKSFLNPDISIELISKDLDIPKYHFSQLFNVHIGKNFYTFIAEHRIKYALNRLNEAQGKLKIESLAHECGFNSKTSFNRYFKQLTGATPLEYQNMGEIAHQNIALVQGLR